MSVKVLLSAKLRGLAGPILGRVMVSAKGRAGVERALRVLAPVPRPILQGLLLAALAYGLWDPEGFAAELEALAEVPDVVWWALGAGAVLGFGGGAGPSGGAGVPPEGPL